MSQSIDIMADWMELCRLRKACRDAASLPEQLHAIAEYQGALARFAEIHHFVIGMAVASASRGRQP